MYLIFDTETTGLDKSKRRLIELGWLLVDDSKEIIKEQSYLIYPDGFDVPISSTKKHGITRSMLIRDGEPIKLVLQRFVEDLLNVDYVVAHNITFDSEVLAKEFLLARMENPLNNKHEICTMKLSTDFCKIKKKNQRGYKYPKLQELHLKLFANYFDGEHRAMNDVYACKECFFKLLDLNVISIPKQTVRKRTNRTYSVSQIPHIREAVTVEKIITPVVKPAFTKAISTVENHTYNPTENSNETFVKKVNQFWGVVISIILLIFILNPPNMNDEKNLGRSKKDDINVDKIVDKIAQSNISVTPIVQNQPPVTFKQAEGEMDTETKKIDTINAPSIAPSVQLSTAPQKQDEKLVDGVSLNQKGIEKINEGKPEESIAYFLRAIEFSPHNAEILGNLAFAYYQLGDHNKALPYIEQSLRVSPKRGASWLHLGQIQAIHGNVKEAIYSFELYLRYSTNKKAAVGQLRDWSNGLYDGRYQYIREASIQALINEGYLSK